MYNSKPTHFNNHLAPERSRIAKHKGVQCLEPEKGKSENRYFKDGLKQVIPSSPFKVV